MLVGKVKNKEFIHFGVTLMSFFCWVSKPKNKEFIHFLSTFFFFFFFFSFYILERGVLFPPHCNASFTHHLSLLFSLANGEQTKKERERERKMKTKTKMKTKMMTKKKGTQKKRDKFESLSAPLLPLLLPSPPSPAQRGQK